MTFTRRGFLQFLWRGFVVVASLAGYSVGVEAMARPRVTRYTISPPNWTPGLKLRIIALADFHACEPWMSAARIRSICERANELEGDVVVLLGDYASGMNLVIDYVDSAEWADALSVLKAPLGVHAILGNHDYWEDLTFQRDPSVATFGEKALLNVGIPVHVNRAVRLEKDGSPFWLAGLGDQVAMRPGKRFNRNHFGGLDDLPGTLAQVTDTAPVILLAHEPDIFPDVPPRVSLTLSGHTHGGQVNLLGWTPVVPSRFGGRYAGGHIEESGNHLIVSRGLGCSILPVRFGAWPEIVMIELG